jgi:hypothetical protein
MIPGSSGIERKKRQEMHITRKKAAQFVQVRSVGGNRAALRVKRSSNGISKIVLVPELHSNEPRIAGLCPARSLRFGGLKR